MYTNKSIARMIMYPSAGKTFCLGKRNFSPQLPGHSHYTTRHSSQRAQAMPNISAQFSTRAGSTQQHGTVPISPEQIKECRTRHALHFHTLQECVSKHSNAQIKECNSKQRPDNSAQFPARAGSAKLGTVPIQTLRLRDRSRNTDQVQ